MARDDAQQGFRSLIEQIQARGGETPPVSRTPVRRSPTPRPTAAPEAASEAPTAASTGSVRLLERRWL